VGQVVYLSPVEPFLVYLKVALFGGLVLASPLVLWEVWSFLRPALRFHELQAVRLFLPFGVGLFFLGAWFGWNVFLPVSLNFLLQFGSENLTPMLSVGHYIGFAGWLLLACGLFFEMPMVLLLLVRLKMIRPLSLLRQWRVAALSILVGAAVLTPTPDVVTQLLLAVPMGVLYLISVAMAFLMERGRLQGGSVPP